MSCATIQLVFAFSDVLGSERERCATNELNPSLGSAQASRIKQKSHRGDEQYWKAKNHSATKLAVGGDII